MDKYFNTEGICYPDIHYMVNLDSRTRQIEKMVDSGKYFTIHRYNSPWNIAADFNIDMSFSLNDIKGMLDVYENNYNTGMDLDTVSGLVYKYISGYPYLVSYICKLIDEKISFGDYWDKARSYLKYFFIICLYQNNL